MMVRAAMTAAASAAEKMAAGTRANDQMAACLRESFTLEL